MRRVHSLLFVITFMFLMLGRVNADTVYVSVLDMSFSPANFAVKVGDYVKWTLVAGTHTTTSMTVPAGAASWNYTFTGIGDFYVYPVTVSGDYSYECLFHPGMEGTFSAGEGLLLNENFDYGGTDNPDLLNLTSNWVRHSGTQGPSYSSVSLTYAGYPSSGIGGAVNFTNGASGVNDGDINRTFDSVYSTHNAYVSFMLNVSSALATADYFFHVGPKTIGTTFRGRVFVRANAPGWSFGLSKSTETRVDDNTILNFNQTYLVVLKYAFNTDALNDDLVTLYVYESGVPVTEPGSPLLTIGPLGAGTAGDPANIGSIAIRQGTNTPTGKIDGIRVTSTWDQIVPVELASFNASVSGTSVLLNWVTSSEVNNSGFEVERKSSNSVWQKIGFVQGNGTTTEAISYSFADNNLASGTYSYRLKQIDYDGSFAYSNEIMADVDMPVNFALQQNYPNPFNPSTSITFSIPEAQFVTLKVYNALGQEIKTLVNGVKDAGIHRINFDASALNSGIYFYKIDAGTFSQVKKMTLIK